MKTNEQPIGVFDSGLGGISVLRELVKLMPNENFIYLGDSKNAPYGTKTHDEVCDLSIKNVELLLENDAKSIVIACNTATSVAVNVLRERFADIPIVGMEPALKPAVLNKKLSNIVVMATPMTLRETKFANLIRRFQNDANIISLPCPGLVEFVEKGVLDGEEVVCLLNRFLKSTNVSKIDSIVLGCTHYPFLKNAIKKAVGYEVALFDGGEGTARQMKRQLYKNGLNNNCKKLGKVKFLNSDEDCAMLNLSKKLFYIYKD